MKKSPSLSSPCAMSDKVLSLLQRAKAGDMQAQYDLGWNYYLGYSVPQDDRKAAEWIAKAFDNGFD